MYAVIIYNAYKLKKYLTKCIFAGILVYNIKGGYLSSVQMIHALLMTMYNLKLSSVTSTLTTSLFVLIVLIACKLQFYEETEPYKKM
jgi:hypothetical protein